MEKKVERGNLVYRKSEYAYSFKYFSAIKTFGRDIYNHRITLNEP